MKFYGREQESESLEKIWAQSFHTQRYAGQERVTEVSSWGIAVAKWK